MASYATVESLQGYLEQVTPTAANVRLLQKQLDRATGIIRDEMRNLLADPSFDYVAWPVASAKTITSYGGPYLQLPPHQAGTVTLVKYGTSTVASTTYIETAQGSLQVISSAGLTYPMYWLHPGYATWGLAQYSITAIWGYGPTVPSSIEELTLELAVNLWRTRDTGGFRENIGVEGSGGIRMVTGLSENQEAIIMSVCAQLYQVAV